MEKPEEKKELDRIAKLIELEKQLATYSGPDRVVSSHDLKTALENQADSPNYIRSGYPRLDYLLDGFTGGELTTVSGPTGNGKTLFCQSLTWEFAKQDKNSLWFTYEVPAKQFLKQFGKEMPEFFMPAELAGQNFSWIEKKIIEAKIKYGLHAVFVDHLHFILDMKTKNNMSLEIGSVMRNLKKMALRHDLCFFLVSHIGKTSKMTTEPDIDDLRDSSFTGQESDNVFFIWRSTKNENQAVLKVAKNRREGVFNKKVKLIKVDNYLRELTDGD